MTARKTSEAQWLAHEWKPRSWEEFQPGFPFWPWHGHSIYTRAAPNTMSFRASSHRGMGERRNEAGDQNQAEHRLDASDGFDDRRKRGPATPKRGFSARLRAAAEQGAAHPSHETPNQLNSDLTTTSTGKPPPTPTTCAKLDTNARIRHTLFRPAERQNAQIPNLLRRPAMYRCPRA